MQTLKLYAATAAVFFAVDLVWIGVVAAPFYRTRMGALLAPEVRWVPALIFYLVYVAGVLVFAALPGIAAGSLRSALALGAFFGFVAYATFDLTALALLRDFPVAVVVVDMLWGTALTTVTAGAAWAIGRHALGMG